MVMIITIMLIIRGERKAIADVILVGEDLPDTPGLLFVQ